MAEMPVSTRIIRTNKRKPFSGDGTLVADTLTLMDTAYRMQPMSELAVREIDVSFGIKDDPTDEIVEWYIGTTTVDNLPAKSSIQNVADWYARQVWRSIGTDSGPVQTFERQHVENLIPKVVSNMELSRRRESMGICLTIWANTGSGVHASGHISFQEALVQRNWRSDSSEPPDEYDDELT